MTVREDVERAMRKPKQDVPNFDLRDITWEDAAKGGAAIVGGSIAGRWAGKRLRRWLNDKQLPKHAMEVVKRHNDTRVLTPPSGVRRFRKAGSG